jgi:hypothetical protein
VRGVGGEVSPSGPLMPIAILSSVRSQIAIDARPRRSAAGTVRQSGPPLASLGGDARDGPTRREWGDNLIKAGDSQHRSQLTSRSRMRLVHSASRGPTTTRRESRASSRSFYIACGSKSRRPSRSQSASRVAASRWSAGRWRVRLSTQPRKGAPVHAAGPRSGTALARSGQAE